MILAAPVQAGRRHHGESHRSGADHGDHVAGLHLPVLDPDLEARRQDVAEQHALLVRDALGHLVHGCLGVRHPHVLGLGAVDQVAEDPADPRRSLVTQAVREDALLAEAAVTARLDAGDDHVVADRELGHRAAHLGDHADTLVAEDPAGRDRRHVALEDVQVGAADRRRVDPHDDVRRILDLRIRRIGP